jgi:hypothetical protein
VRPGSPTGKVDQAALAAGDRSIAGARPTGKHSRVACPQRLGARATGANRDPMFLSCGIALAGRILSGTP